MPVSVVSSNEQEQEEICFTDIIEADGRVVFVEGSRRTPPSLDLTFPPTGLSEN